MRESIFINPAAGRYCRTANFRVQEISANFGRFAKISCMLIFSDYIKGHGLTASFPIRNYCWKAEDPYFLEIRENFLHANCKCPKFAKISCREIFLFYSNTLGSVRPFICLFVLYFQTLLFERIGAINHIYEVPLRSI